MDSRRADGPAALRPGAEPIAGYRLVRRRGRGGFGEVWEAEGSGGIHVALKFVHGSPRARESELRALNVFRGVRHPNVLANFGAWEADGTLVVGMELADGSLWDRYVRAADEGLGGIPRSELLGYMADAAAGLDYLNDPRHTVDGRPGVGIQHRDVKPPNILLFGGGAKLADLGMARALEGDQGGHTGTWTFSYAAPEFFRGRTARQSDQYGLAATYCQLRCGRLPFEGGAAAVTAGHLYGRPDLDGLPEAERSILARALAKEPGDRWADCRSLVEALRALAPDQAPEVVPRPEEPADDIPRAFRSSTSAGEGPPAGLGDFEDTPPPSWMDFEPGEGLDSLMHTAETAPAAPLSSRATAVLPDLGPKAGPKPIARPRAGAGRFGRLAASTLAVGLAVVAAGVRPTMDPGPSPRPSKPVEAGGKPASVAVLAPVAKLGPPAPGRIERARPAPEVEPAPARAADEIPRTSASPVESEGKVEGPATRSDLVPARRAAPAPGPSPAGIEAAKAEAEGRVHLASHVLDRAIADFDRAIRLRPGVASAYFHRGLARHRASHYPEALADYSEAIRLRPSDPSAFLARGQAHHDLGAYDRAVEDYSEAIRLRPSDPDAWSRRGMASYRADDYARAVADFDEALRLDPKGRRAREFRDDALARLGGRGRGAARPRPAPPAAIARPPVAR